MFYGEFCNVSKSAFSTRHLRWLLLGFILVASVVVTWVSWFMDTSTNWKPRISSSIFSREIFQMLEFLLFFKLFSADIHLFKVWLKRSQNEYIFSFSILKCHIIVQTNRKNELFFKGEHSYK